MEATKESLEELYASMDIDDLLRLKAEGNLTEMAAEVIEAELRRRWSPEAEAAQERLEADMERQKKNEDEALVGIRGWLILPAIGFVLGPVIGVVALFVAYGMYPDVERAGYGGVYALELLVSTGLMGLLIYASVLFFQKRKNAPRVIILLFTLSIVASFLLLVVEIAADAEVFAAESAKQLAGDVIRAAIWIPYFRVSKRVKATFVH